ncbi:MAG: ribonuclease D [Propioniciclava sp.]
MNDTDTNQPELLSRPAEGIPPVITTAAALEEATQRLQTGSGPVAVDTERAHGFRYWPKAYLVQLRRTGAGTHLIDPTAFEGGADRADFSMLADTLAGTEWVLHAASQDLPCLAEVKLLPTQLFDTELAGRLLGYPRVALGALVERALGITLAKEHSAADWSRRPLPEDWLSYAALDVELLIPLRSWVQEQLAVTGRTEWAEQEFAHLLTHAAEASPHRKEPWRRVSGLHTVRTSRGLAAVQALWTARDQLGQQLDRAPGRILGDRAISEVGAAIDTAQTFHLGKDGLRRIKGFRWRLAARHESTWLAALDQAAELPAAAWPPKRAPVQGIPAPKSWARRHPEAAARWERVRPAVRAHAETLGIPPENLIAPEALRRIAWDPPATITAESVESALAESGVRPWQREQVQAAVTAALPEP